MQDTKIDECFEAIQSLAIKGKAITQDENIKKILDDINSIARYRSNVANQNLKEEKN